jgi:GNAT superfamily N-acetyltransferase
METAMEGYTISTDASLVDIEAVHGYLSGQSYWATGRSLETVRRSIEHSLCFGVYDATGGQAGFARVITDYATFGWLCDLFILDAHKGRGLGKWLVQTIVAHPDLTSVKRIQLATRDAHELYSRYGGFAPLAAPALWMERVQEKT